MRSLAVNASNGTHVFTVRILQPLAIIAPTLLASIICLYFQNNFLNHDVAYLLYASNEMLHGGNYVHNFFETNPPLILYLYAPVCILAKIFSVNSAHFFKYYIFLLSLLSVYASYFFLSRMTDDKLICLSTLVALLFVTLIFPLYDFGQREHLAVIFVLPYLFSTALYAQGKSATAMVAILVGLLAGLGFAIKPFFLIPLCLCEFYLIIQKKNLSGWVRMESLLVLSVMISYFILIATVHTDYIHTIYPLVSRYYYPGVHQSIYKIVSTDCCLFSLGSLVAALLLYKKELRELTTVLLMAQMGFLAAYVCGGTDWFYHILPALSFSIIAITLLFAQSLSALRQPTVNALPVKYFILTALFFMSLSLIENNMMQRYFIFSAEHRSENRLLDFISRSPNNGGVYCFSMDNTSPCFPRLVTDANRINDSRYPSFWWMGIAAMDNTKADIRRDQEYFNNDIAADIKFKQPQWVIVYQSSFSEFLPDFEVIKYLSRNQNFAFEWRHYALKNQFFTGKYLVYERLA
jgi:hypothetical protein